MLDHRGNVELGKAVDRPAPVGRIDNELSITNIASVDDIPDKLREIKHHHTLAATLQVLIQTTSGSIVICKVPGVFIRCNKPRQPDTCLKVTLDQRSSRYIEVN